MLRDPEGEVDKETRKESLSSEERLIGIFLAGNAIPPNNWTASIKDIPNTTHSVVENFFQNVNDNRHITEGYAFSKTKNFETSGKPLRVNVVKECDMFLLEGSTRPAMTQAKGISSGSGIYSCIVVFRLSTGGILAARDRTCAAGKRGYCKHVAALCYKLVEAKMSGAAELPASLSCTDVRQQWGIPSLRAQQDPEKEAMKKQPLHEIKVEKHLLTHDKAGGRKRKGPEEMSENYSATPPGEPLVDFERVEAFRQDLAQSKCSQLVKKVLCLSRPKTQQPEQPSIQNKKKHTSTEI